MFYFFLHHPIDFYYVTSEIWQVRTWYSAIKFQTVKLTKNHAKSVQVNHLGHFSLRISAQYKQRKHFLVMRIVEIYQKVIIISYCVFAGKAFQLMA